jgi:hypothetical protein
VLNGAWAGLLRLGSPIVGRCVEFSDGPPDDGCVLGRARVGTRGRVALAWLPLRRYEGFLRSELGYVFRLRFGLHGCTSFELRARIRHGQGLRFDNLAFTRE